MSARGAIRVLAFLGLVSGGPGYVLAQEQSGVGVVSTLMGEATVARGTTSQPLALKMRDNVFMRDRISTKERSLVHVLMGGKALLTVRELSVLIITEEGGRATVDLQSGKVGLAVVRQRMKPGETIEIRTPHAVAAVRGTVLVVEIIPGSGGEARPEAGAASTNIHLLHGTLGVSLVSNPNALPIQLESLQSVTVSRHALGTVRPLTPESVAAVTANLRMNRPSLPGPSEKFVASIEEKQRALAVATASTLVDGQHGKARVTGFAAKPEAGQKGKATDVGADGEPIGVVSDAGDDNLGGNGNGRAVSLGAGSGGPGLGLIGGGGNVIRLQGPVSVSGSGGLVSDLAPVVPKLQLLPKLP